MKILKDKKIIGSIVICCFILILSMFIYKNNEGKEFKEEYMTEIFEDDSSKINEESIASVETFNENNVVKKSNIIVEIKGEVNNPDVYELEEGSIVKDLIDMAGGLKEEADISNINRAEELKNHQLVVIGNINDESQESSIVSSSSEVSSDSGSFLININTATLDELKKITGIGDTKAQNIIDYREKNNGFKSLEDIKNVDGIGEKTFEKIKSEITL